MAETAGDGVVDIIIRDGSMGCHSIVPQRYGLIVPLDSDLQVCRDGDVLEQTVNPCLAHARIRGRGRLRRRVASEALRTPRPGGR